jgi:hypothetical protein
MNLNLEVNEVQFILQTLGQLPSSSGVWPLIVKVKEQAEAKPSAVQPEIETKSAGHNSTHMISGASK